MLKKASFVIAVIVEVIVCILVGIDSFKDLWIPLVVFISTLVLVPIIFVLFAIMLLPTISVKKDYETVNPFYRFILNVVLEALCDYGRAKIITNNTNLIPDTPCLFVYNHRSRFDPIVLSVVMKKKVVVQISKPENFKIPVAGPHIKRNCYLPIDRENPREAMKAINKAVKHIKDNCYYCGVAPEGTRNKGAEDLLPFRDGCFKIALKAECPIVVVRLHNAEKICKNFPFKKTKVYMNVLGVLEYDDIKEMKTTEISDIARNMIENDKIKF